MTLEELIQQFGLVTAERVGELLEIRRVLGGYRLKHSF